MKSIIFFTNLIILAGCMTPKNWGPEQHQDTMMQCRVACKGHMKTYEPYSGECNCYAPKK